MPKRTDANQNAIMQELRVFGLVVADTHVVGDGFPDLVVCGIRHGKEWCNLLVEIKTARGKLTPAEKKFHDNWPGPSILAWSAEDVLEYFGIAPVKESLRR